MAHQTVILAEWIGTYWGHCTAWHHTFTTWKYRLAAPPPLEKILGAPLALTYIWFPMSPAYLNKKHSLVTLRRFSQVSQPFLDRISVTLPSNFDWNRGVRLGRRITTDFPVLTSYGWSPAGGYTSPPQYWLWGIQPPFFFWGGGERQLGKGFQAKISTKVKTPRI